MKIINKVTIIMFLSVVSHLIDAEILLYQFTDPVKEERFNQLIKELRCPKCQNNNLADSNAPLAVDLKDIVYEKINAGQTDNEIIYFLKERYGDFISYRPPVKPSTWLIWYGPFVVLIIGGIMIFRFVASRQKSLVPLTQTEPQQSGDDLLASWSNEIDDEDDS